MFSLYPSLIHNYSSSSIFPADSYGSDVAEREFGADPITQRIQIGLFHLPKEDSKIRFEILKRWLRDCDNNHATCKGPNKSRRPTRLLDVGTEGRPYIRLYETQPKDTMEYLALSHPWGSPPHFCTYPTNIDEHKQQINFHSLPLTFQHAVTVTRSLGVRYLWIDSICIIQGPDGDFIHEAKHMGDVFNQAYCVLAGTSATGQRDGFLKRRKQRRAILVKQKGRAPFYICRFMDDFGRDVLNSDLNRRGWVLQERVLARRTIYFASQQIYWECGQGVRCETLTKMKK